VRLAVISDIHGSLRALQSVVSRIEGDAPDLTVQGGDLALNGPRPAEVIDFIREHDLPGVLGNTDELLWRPELQTELVARMPRLRGLLEVLFEHAAPVTRELLGAERMNWLRALPREWLAQDRTAAVIHASPGDLWSAPQPDADDRALADVYSAIGTGIAVYGHIHRPFVRQLGGITVANSGSVGMPYDGDPRASYLLIEDGRARVRRVEYDVDGEVADLLSSGYPHAAWLAGIRRSGTYTPPTS
jgi:predicted phosphodiesterase